MDKAIKLLIGSIVWLLAHSPSCMASPILDQAIGTFNMGQYPLALYQFQQELRNNPDDALAHYYCGLCYHHLNKLSDATREYKWVLLNTQDPELIHRVQLGLQVLSSAPPPQPPKANVAKPVPAAKTPSTTAGAQQPKAATYRIYHFYATWSDPCTRFMPILHEAENVYRGKIFLQSLNAEDPANAALVKKYQVRCYPTVVFLDPAGKMTDKLEGAPLTLGDFRMCIAKAFPAFR